MNKYSFIAIAIILFLTSILSLSFASADIVSISGDGSGEHIVIPEEMIEGFFFGDVASSTAGGTRTSSKSSPFRRSNLTFDCTIFNPYLDDLLRLTQNASIENQNLLQIKQLFAISQLNQSFSDQALSYFVLENCADITRDWQRLVYFLIITVVTILTAIAFGLLMSKKKKKDAKSKSASLTAIPRLTSDKKKSSYNK